MLLLANSNLLDLASSRLWFLKVRVGKSASSRERWVDELEWAENLRSCSPGFKTGVDRIRRPGVVGIRVRG